MFLKERYLTSSFTNLYDGYGNGENTSTTALKGRLSGHTTGYGVICRK